MKVNAGAKWLRQEAMLPIDAVLQWMEDFALVGKFIGFWNLPKMLVGHKSEHVFSVNCMFYDIGQHLWSSIDYYYYLEILQLFVAIHNYQHLF